MNFFKIITLLQFITEIFIGSQLRYLQILDRFFPNIMNNDFKGFLMNLEIVIHFEVGESTL